jgi:adenine deaminase
VQGLGEVMDYPGVLSGGPVWQVLSAARQAVKDGHAPGLSGPRLAGYMMGDILTDHETADPALLLERKRVGMWLLAREGTAARDLDRVIPFLLEHGLERTALCTDDRHAATLLEEHHIDGMVARLTAAGLPPREVLKAATLAPAELYRLHDRGAISPGLRADLLLVEDPTAPHPSTVVQGGRVTVDEGGLLAPIPGTPSLPPRTVRARLEPDAMVAPLGPEWRKVLAVEVQPGTLLTGSRVLRARRRGDRLESSDGTDAAFLTLLERHRGTGEAGAGFVTGTGLRSGALASTVGHDSHQLIVLGREVPSMLAAAGAVARAGGGLAVAEGERTQVLPLPLAGLMSDRPAEEVAGQLRLLELRARELGCTLPSPFMVLSFLSLTVIPQLRITVHGLLDVDQGRLVPALLG